MRENFCWFSQQKNIRQKFILNGLIGFNTWDESQTIVEMIFKIPEKNE